VIDELLTLGLAHLRLTLISVAIATLLGVALGLGSLRSRALERTALSAASLVQTVPALALLAVMVPALAWIGQHTGAPISGIGELPALIGLTLYAILPIARGVVLGVRGIDRAVGAAALAVGMTEGERLRLIELPLAAPVIVGGLRTATAWTVGMAMLATPVGAASLGNLIFAGLQTRHYDRVALGCAGSAALALALDVLLALCERRIRSQRGLTLLAAGLGLSASLALLLGLVPVAAKSVRVGAKSFTEQLVLAEVLRCALADEAPLDVRSSLGTSVAFDALRHDELDAYVEYTGTAWTTLLHRSDTLDRSSLRAAVEAGLAQRYGVHVVAYLGFENAYALVVRNAEQVRKVSDLGSARQRVFGGDYEFFERPEWRALRERYGIAPQSTRVMDPSLLYAAIAARSVDVIAGYTTDGRIDTLGLRALDDDLAAMPPYDAIVLVSPRVWRERPELVARLRRLDRSIDAPTMRRWNAQVDGGASPRAAAATHALCRAVQHRR
jgi:osmoprotectant transport system permease protein